jgi:hypothetical protein
MAPKFTTFVYDIKSNQNITNEIEQSGSQYIVILVTNTYLNECLDQEEVNHHVLKNEILKIEKLQKYLRTKKEGVIKFESTNETYTAYHVKNGEAQIII